MKSVDTPVNVLVSFAYAGKDKRLLRDALSLVDSEKINLMIDSGAFSAFNNKGFDYVTLDNYCRFIETIEDKIEKYVMLDVIGNAKKSRENYETMISRGLSPMFVVTMFDDDFAYIKHAVSNNPHVCVAGGATVKNDWLVQRYQKVLKASDGSAKIHGLAFVTFPKMMMCGLASVDSSSWHVGASKYGDAGFFDAHGIHSFTQARLIKRIKDGDKALREVLDRLGVAKADLVSPSSFHGQVSLAVFLRCRAQMEMQRYVYRRGLRLFLAASNYNAMSYISYFTEHWDSPTYQGFKGYVTRASRQEAS